MLTLMPRASRRQPIEAAARPLPSEDTTPPVTKMYFADMSATSLFDFLICAWCARLSIAGSGRGGNGEGFVGIFTVDLGAFVCPEREWRPADAREVVIDL